MTQPFAVAEPIMDLGTHASQDAEGHEVDGNVEEDQGAGRNSVTQQRRSMPGQDQQASRNSLTEERRSTHGQDAAGYGRQGTPDMGATQSIRSSDGPRVGAPGYGRQPTADMAPPRKSDAHAADYKRQATADMEAKQGEPLFEVFQDPPPMSPPAKDSKATRGRMSTGDTNPDTPSTTASSMNTPRKAPQQRQQKLFTIPQPISGHSVLNLSTFHNSPRYTFQPPFRDHNTLHVPGPGNYTHDGKLVGKKPEHVLTLRPASPSRAPSPGPGGYDIKPRFGDGKHSSMGERREPKRSLIPGPGAYHHKEVMGAGSGFTVQVPRDDHNRGKPVPGPGHYKGEDGHLATNVKNPQFTMPGPGSRHTAAFGKNGHPGPGAYEFTPRLGEGKKSSHGLPKQKRVDTSPGPGHYGGAYTTFHMS